MASIQQTCCDRLHTEWNVKCSCDLFLDDARLKKKKQWPGAKAEMSGNHCDAIILRLAILPQFVLEPHDEFISDDGEHEHFNGASNFASQ